VSTLDLAYVGIGVATITAALLLSLVAFYVASRVFR